MNLNRWTFCAALAVASSRLGGFVLAQEEAKPAEPILVRTQVITQAEAAAEALAQQELALVADEVSPYWIGVQLEPPADILKQHLNLEGGMVAVHVFEGSPAEKAGLKANDIILKAGDAYVKEPGDLLKCVGAAKGNEITLVIIHAGKETAVKVTPAKRPQEPNAEAVKEAATEQKEAVKKLTAALELYKKHAAAGAGEAKAVDVLRVRPGVVTGGAVGVAELPKDVSVTITKEGSGPAKITVKKDGKQYETTEDKLDQLPQEIQACVQLTRSGGPGAMFYRAKIAPTAMSGASAKSGAIYKAVPVPTPALPARSVEAAKVYRYHVESKHAAGDVDSKLDQILKIVSQQEDSGVSDLRKEVQQLRKELEELRKEKK
jgi:membrane-associated protease RseP (regulator of RpoE activity)